MGLLDDPARQWQGQWFLDLTVAGGHAAVIGGPQSGKTTLLRTLVLSLALTHTPREVGVYGLDLVGGGLQALSGLPHVGGIAGRADRERAARTVEEVRTMLALRESLFREHGIDSVEQLRGLHAAGQLPELASAEILLVIDGFGALRDDFDELDDAVADILKRGGGYGVHVVAGMLRWNDVRIAVQSNFGTRVELRLNDPGESSIDRKLAETLSPEEPGRVLTDAKLFAQVALPRTDGVADTVGLGAVLERTARTVRATWSGEVAQPVRVLPHTLEPHVLPGPAAEPTRVPIGLDQAALAPVLLDLFQHDQHLLILGDSECGKTNLLRAVAHGLVDRFGEDELVFAVMDPRRSLRGAVPEEFNGGYAYNAKLCTGLSAGIATELEKRLPDENARLEDLEPGNWGKGPRIVVLVDDYDVLTTATVAAVAVPSVRSVGGRHRPPLRPDAPGRRCVERHVRAAGAGAPRNGGFGAGDGGRPERGTALSRRVRLPTGAGSRCVRSPRPVEPPDPDGVRADLTYWTKQRPRPPTDDEGPDDHPMTKDVIALTPRMPDPWAVLAGLLSGGPDKLVGTRGEGAVVQLCDREGRPLVSVEAPLLVSVEGEAERLLGAVPPPVPYWWTEARATTGVAEAEQLASTFAARLAALIGGSAWPPDAVGSIAVVKTDGVSVAPEPAAAQPAIDVLTERVAVVIQDRPVVAMTAWLSDAFRAAATAGLGLQIVSPADTTLSPAVRDALGGRPSRWIVQDDQDGYYDGLTGAVLRWQDGSFDPVLSPDATEEDPRTPVAAAYQQVHDTGERQLALTFRTVHPADERLVLGGGLEAVWRELTGEPPAKLGNSGTGQPSLVSGTIDGRSTRTGSGADLVRRGRPPVAAGNRHRTGHAHVGVEEEVALAFGYGAGEEPPLDALPVAAEALATRHHLQSMLVQLRKARRDIAVPPRFEGPGVPLAFVLGAEEVRAMPGDWARRVPLDGRPVPLGPRTRQAMYYPLPGDPSDLTGWQEFERLMRHLKGA